MEINKALQVMGFNSIKELKEEGNRGLRKRMVKLAKGQHPDDAGRNTDKAKILGKRLTEINDAYETLKKALKLPVFNNMSANKTEVKIVKFEELCKLYTGEKEEVQSIDGTGVTKGTLRLKSVLIQIDVNITVDGTYYKETVYVPWNVMDRYEVSIKIEDNELDKEREMYIKIGEMGRIINSKATSVLVPITSNYASINVYIERVTSNGEKG